VIPVDSSVWIDFFRNQATPQLIGWTGISALKGWW
jgi:hypothetical protein